MFLDFEPVLRNGVGQGNRIKKIERFNEERIGAELVRLVDIADSVRSSQDDDGNILEHGLATNPAQDFKAVGYGQSEIEQEKAGYRIKLTIGVASNAGKIANGFLTVANDHQRIRNTACFESPLNQDDVVFSILREQDGGFVVHSRHPRHYLGSFSVHVWGKSLPRGDHMLFMLIGLLGEQPIIEDDIENFDKMSEIVGLFEVGIRAQTVGFGDILIQAGTAQHDGAQPRELRLVAQPMQDFQAGHSRHLEVEDEQIREWEFIAVAKLPFPLQVLNDFHAVGDFKYPDGFLIPTQGQVKQATIVGIVFGQEHCKLDCKFVIHIPPKDNENGARRTVGRSPRQCASGTQGWTALAVCPTRRFGENVPHNGVGIHPICIVGSMAKYELRRMLIAAFKGQLRRASTLFSMQA